MNAQEHAGDIVFLYQVKAGPASQSYGIEVAKLAGLPEAVLTVARQRLSSFEQANLQPQQNDLFAVDYAPPTPIDTESENLLDQLRQAKPNDMTPMQALALIQELHDAASRLTD